MRSQQDVVGALPAFGGGPHPSGGAGIGNLIAPLSQQLPHLPQARCKSCQQLLTHQEIATSAVAPACTACQEKYDDDSYCRVCLEASSPCHTWLRVLVGLS